MGEEEEDGRGRMGDGVCVCVVVRRNEDVDPGRKGGGGRGSEGEWDDRCMISYHHMLIHFTLISTLHNLLPCKLSGWER